MSSTRVAGARVTGTSDTTMYTGAGRLDAILISHGTDARGETVVIKDGSTELATIVVHSYNSPYFVRFGHHKLDGIPFSASLVVNPGSNCKVNVWYYGY